ncbi:MAG: glycosyltransferase [Planctomycetota bacterium]
MQNDKDDIENRPLVSVVVPIYNVEPYLPQCVESLINQTWQNLEIVLVNDGSTDDCAAICDRYAASDPRVKVIHQQNSGLIPARKAGLEAATGEYVACVDGDDWVEPDMYRDMMNHALEHNADVVVGGHKEDLLDHVEVLLNNVPPGVYDKERLIKEVYPKMVYTGYFSQFGIFSYVWGKLYRKSVIYEHQMRVDPEIHIGEDASCLYPTLLDAEVVCVIDSTAYHYRQRVDSMIKTPKFAETKKVEIFYRFLHDVFAESPYADMLIHQLKHFVLSLLIVRSDALPEESSANGGLVPFSEVAPGSRIAVCGAGTFGQHLYKRLRQKGQHELVGWVDDLHETYRQMGLTVDPPATLDSTELDYVLIAYIDETFSKTVKEKLIGLGLPANKLLNITYRGDHVDQLLENYGISI